MWEQNTFMFFSGTDEYNQEALNRWKNYYPNSEGIKNVYHCFEAYFNYSAESSFDKDFFFSFPALPVWYKRVIKKLNRYFKNINYEIIDEKSVFINPINPNIQTTETAFTQKAICPLIKLNLSTNYSKVSKYYLRYLLHHIIRIMSYPEKFLEINEVEHDKKYDSIQWLCDLNNRNPGYRSITEGTLFKDMFKYLDNVDLVNKTVWLGWGSYNKVRQTGIFSNILTTADWKFNPKFNIGDLVKPNDGANRYSVSNKDTIQAEVIKNHTFGQVSIRILKHRNISIRGYTAIVDENTFDLYEEVE